MSNEVIFISKKKYYHGKIEIIKTKWWLEIGHGPGDVFHPYYMPGLQQRLQGIRLFLFQRIDLLLSVLPVLCCIHRLHNGILSCLPGSLKFKAKGNVLFLNVTCLSQNIFAY